MRRMLGMVTLIIGYGSLYPFNFDPMLASTTDWSTWFFDVSAATSRGDILGNVLLFFPLGFIAAYGWHDGERLHHRSWRLGVVLGACFFALLLQMLQVMLPTRIASMSDTWANIAGLLLGLIIYRVIASRTLAQYLNSDRVLVERVVPAFLLCCWLGYLWFPFIPSMRLDQFLYSFRPLSHWHLVTPFAVLDDWFSWSIFWWLLNRFLARPLKVYQQLLLIALIILVQAGLLRNILSLASLFAALLALVTLPLVTRMKEYSLALALLFWWSLKVWFPFNWVPDSSALSLIPFARFLTGSHWINSFIIFETLFFLGAIAYCLRFHPSVAQTDWRRLQVPVVATLWIALVEVGQIAFGERRIAASSSLLFALLFFSMERLKQSAESQLAQLSAKQS
ncbi:MAG: VanZ family protein [Gammaproteobacteria bacterium]|nr:VanZ family protein [Gammaproteobacteria bacterium]NVK89280.1 VanZ family protein [Gammaproteobacteria bacterium]